LNQAVRSVGRCSYDPERVPTYYNLGAIRAPHLFQAARSLNREGHPGPAVVVAQAAVEVGVERAVGVALEVRDVPEDLREWIESSTTRSWSPTNRNVRRLWKALVGYELGSMEGWSEYEAGVAHRHRFAHRAGLVTEEQAEAFIADAERVLDRLTESMLVLNPPEDDDPES
jgi:hypothetical protein